MTYLEGEAVEKVLRKGPVRGHVLRSSPGGKVELVPWQHAARVPRNGKAGEEVWNRHIFQEVEVPQEAQQRMLESLPPEVRRTPRQRYQALVTRLVHDAMRSKERTGKVVWPKSIEDEIKRLSWMEGDPTLLQRIEQGSLEAIEKYAGHQMGEAARAQKQKDAHKVALDWHGHYNQ